MLYVKSIMIGSVTLVLSVIAYVVIWAWWMYRTNAPVVPPGTEISLDLRAVLSTPLFYIVAVSGFMAGFALSFRHASQ
jgi:hypothetical protein